jgi:hypothetical protein
MYLSVPFCLFLKSVFFVNLLFFLSSCLFDRDFSFNAFAGSLPVTLFTQVAHLQSVNFAGNHFSGNLPPELFTEILSDTLLTIDLSRNQIAGSIPASIGLLSGLNFLNLSNNLLTGSIPVDLSNCSHLSVLGMFVFVFVFVVFVFVFVRLCWCAFFRFIFDFFVVCTGLFVLS